MKVPASRTGGRGELRPRQAKDIFLCGLRNGAAFRVQIHHTPHGVKTNTLHDQTRG